MNAQIQGKSIPKPRKEQVGNINASWLSFFQASRNVPTKRSLAERRHRRTPTPVAVPPSFANAITRPALYLGQEVEQVGWFECFAPCLPWSNPRH